MQEHHPAPAPTPRGASRKRKLSSPSEAAVVMMDSSDRGQLQERNSRVKDDFSGDPSHNIAGQDRYMLLACGCNLYGQLSPMRANMRSGNEQGTADNKFKKIGDDDDGSAMQNASSVIAQDPAVRGIFNDVDMDNSDSRRSAPPTIIDTPTAILGASESLRVLYVGFNCICGKFRIYLLTAFLFLDCQNRSVMRHESSLIPWLLMHIYLYVHRQGNPSYI